MTLEKLELKLEKIEEVNSQQNVILAKMESMFERQQDILEEHQRRSLASEKRIEILEDSMNKVDKSVESQVSFVRGAMFILGGLISLLGLFLKFF